MRLYLKKKKQKKLKQINLNSVFSFLLFMVIIDFYLSIQTAQISQFTRRQYFSHAISPKWNCN